MPEPRQVEHPEPKKHWDPDLRDKEGLVVARGGPRHRIPGEAPTG